VASDQPLKTLFDPGSDKTFVNQRVILKGANGKTVDSSSVNALNGVDVINQRAILEGLTLPEHSPHRERTKELRLVFSISQTILAILSSDLICQFRLELMFRILRRQLHGWTKLLLGNQIMF
jgi:hypothetical protein